MSKQSYKVIDPKKWDNYTTAHRFLVSRTRNWTEGTVPHTEEMIQEGLCAWWKAEMLDGLEPSQCAWRAINAARQEHTKWRTTLKIHGRSAQRYLEWDGDEEELRRWYSKHKIEALRNALDPGDLTDSPDPQFLTENKIVAEDLQGHLLARLSKKHQEIVLLRLEGHNMKETARKAKVSTRAVYTALQKARDIYTNINTLNPCPSPVQNSFQ